MVFLITILRPHLMSSIISDNLAIFTTSINCFGGQLEKGWPRLFQSDQACEVNFESAKALAPLPTGIS